MGKEKKELWIQGLSTLAAFIALGISIYTYYWTNRSQQESTAATLHREHLEVCLQYPKYANASYDKVDSEQQQSDVKYTSEGYEWFVGHALHSGESVLRLSVWDQGWVNTIRDTVRIHQVFIRSKGFPWNHYDSKFQDLMKETLDIKPQ